MEIGIIALIATLIAGLITVIIELLKPSSREKLKFFFRMIGMIWNKLPFKFIGAIISFMVLAFIVIFFYKFNNLFDTLFLSESELLLKPIENAQSIEALSNIRRNIWLLSFAVFGGCIAVWARWGSEKQLRYTQKQLKNSAEINRNDRFAKAVELIDSKSGTIATRGGLRMLRDLASEDPEAEYIRCVEIISHWLIEDAKKLHEHENQTVKGNLLDIAMGIFRIDIDIELRIKLEEKIKNYKEINDWDFWPILEGVILPEVDLKGANLQGANLQNANMQNANLYGANLQNANLHDTDLQNANLYGANLQNAFLYHVKLQGANLQNASLQGSNLWGAMLENAKLIKANLETTDIANAKMQSAKNITKEQILSAKWTKKFRGTIPPELPDIFINDSDVQEWLSKPSE